MMQNGRGRKLSKLELQRRRSGKGDGSVKSDMHNSPNKNRGGKFGQGSGQGGAGNPFDPSLSEISETIGGLSPHKGFGSGKSLYGPGSQAINR